MTTNGTNDNGYQTGPWRLDDLFPGLQSPELQEAVQRLEAQAEAFEAWRSDLDPQMEPETLQNLLQAYDQLVREASRVQGFASLSFAADTQDQHAQSLMARSQQLAAELDNRTMFFKLWWKQLDEEPAQRLLEHSGEFRYWLESLRRERPHTLTEPEEKIVNLKNVNGISALNTLYDAITSRYTFHLTVDGEERELTRGELSVYFRHPQAELRAAAYQELFRVYGEDAPILGQIYQARVRDWRSEYVRLRNYESPIAVRNLANDVPDQVVETLLAVTRDNRDIFQRFFRLKARWLGMDQLRRYDVYAPVVQTEKEYEFGDAVDLVLTSYNQFDSRFAELARRVLDEQHLDSEVRRGKRGGAFCATIAPDLTPWILQSYQGKPDDVATMAHEMGHALHSMLADHHPALTQHASLPLAETASTFGEMLVVDRLLAEENDASVQRSLLFRQMDDAYATILRQAYFAIFERTAHEAIDDGAAVDDLSGLYLENLQEQFGDSLQLSEDFRHEWVAIPHIYKYPFYVYAYAFGQLLVLSLYQQYREEGDSFKPRYVEVLAAGGSDAPAAILQRAGIQIEDEAFWHGGFNVLRDLLGQLEALEVEVVG
ncbi:MAG TPA: M3 family oligoendopeptidase [Candidatus Sulfomarinibacteraceae bacterium]|nr:M3 family oligoendopeptidase [Candidatus Sulfomarinibacteraceae bacterium]